MLLPVAPVPGEGEGAGAVELRSSVADGAAGKLSVSDFSFRLLVLVVSLRLLSVVFFLLRLLSFSSEDGMRPTDVSLDGTGVALAGMEFSYSWLSFSMAERILEFMVTPRVLAKVERSLAMSGIQ